VFVHVTVVPESTVRSSGANAAVPRNSAPLGIETDDAGPPEAAGTAGDGAGVGADGVDDE
jgi:hypothetical protein